MSHRHVALGVASTGIALAFVVLVKLYRHGKKGKKQDADVLRKGRATSRQRARSPNGQAKSNKVRLTKLQTGASAGPSAASAGQAVAVKRRVKPRSPKPAVAQAAGTTAASLTASRSHSQPLTGAAMQAAVSKAASRTIAVAGQEAAAVLQAPAPGPAARSPAAESAVAAVSSNISSPGVQAAAVMPVRQEAGQVPDAASTSAPASVSTKPDGDQPQGIIAAIAAEVRNAAKTGSDLVQHAPGAATVDKAASAPSPTTKPAVASVDSADVAAAVNMRQKEAAAEVGLQSAEAVPLAVPGSKTAAMPFKPTARHVQPTAATPAAAAAAVVESSQDVPAMDAAAQPLVIPAAGQHSRDAAHQAAASPAPAVSDQASVVGADPFLARPEAEAADTPSKLAAISDTPTKTAAAAPASTYVKDSNSTPSRVTMSPAVEAAEEQRSKSKQRLTVADIIRESIKLKQKNERLKQQLNLKSERRGRSSGSTSGSSSRSQAGSSGGSSRAAAQAEVATADTAAADAPLQQEQDQAGNSTLAAAAAAVTAETVPDPQHVTAGSEPASSVVAGADAGAAGTSENMPSSSGNRNGASSSGRRSERERASKGASLSAADLMREMAGIKAENMELVKLLATQLAEVRQQNADLMAAFHRREQLAAVKEEGDGERSSRGTGPAGAGMAATDGGSTPNTGSELGTFKDRLRLPGFGRAPGSAAGSDAGSSLRSAPAGMMGSTPSRGLWKWATGGRHAGGAMTADNMSLPDSMASPRSNISVPVETLVDLLDWAAR